MSARQRTVPRHRPLHSLGQRPKRPDAQRDAGFGSLQRQPAGFARAAGFVLVAHLAVAISGPDRLHQRVHGEGLVGFRTEIIGARQVRPLPPFVRQRQIAGATTR